MQERQIYGYLLTHVDEFPNSKTSECSDRDRGGGFEVMEDEGNRFPESI